MTDADRAGPMVVGPVTLEGRYVRMEPLARAHLDGLCAAGLGGDLFRWMPSGVDTPGEMAAWVDVALAEQEKGTSLPFATVEAATGRAIGSTRFLAIEPAHRRLEIGSTWIGRPWQRSPVNTEAKLLMLRHAFDSLGANRVEFKTDALNTVSRAAILRLGATEEGTFRRHMIVQGGRVRDTVYFSIVDRDWPGVRDRLEAMLALPWADRGR
jgi:RimJ/RimL family protein N-acetyltransferase